jgi:hypothetical protein
MGSDRSAETADGTTERVPQRPPPERDGPMADKQDTATVGTRTSAATSRLIDSLLAGVIPSLLGLAAYAILREGYVWFYQRYGVGPEDVGISQLRMLTGALRFVHLWALSLPGSPLTNILLFMLTAGLLVLLWRNLLPRARRRSRRIDLFVRRHPILLGLVVAMGLLLLTFVWALPIDRSIAGKHLQLGEAVQPEDLAVLSIHASPARVIWVGASQPPRELLTAKLVYLGKADGILVLYQPPDWTSCRIDDCRGVTWKVQESDVVLRIDVNPPDRDAPHNATP